MIVLVPIFLSAACATVEGVNSWDTCLVVDR